MTDRIFIEGLRVQAAHGVRERERSDRQEFIVDISVQFDISRAEKSDALDDTYDYGLLRKIALEEFSGRPRYLIELLAARIADRVLEDVRALEATVTIRKTHIYPDCVPGVTVTRGRPVSL